MYVGTVNVRPWLVLCTKMILCCHWVSRSSVWLNESSIQHSAVQGSLVHHMHVITIACLYAVMSLPNLIIQYRSLLPFLLLVSIVQPGVDSVYSWWSWIPLLQQWRWVRQPYIFSELFAKKNICAGPWILDLQNNYLRSMTFWKTH